MSAAGSSLDHERWALEVAIQDPFGLPGMWWTREDEDRTISNAFKHFTLNSDDHPLLCRFHQANEEKRGVAILRPENYDDWLSSTNPEFGRALIKLCVPEELNAYPAPKVPPAENAESDERGGAAQQSLF